MKIEFNDNMKKTINEFNKHKIQESSRLFKNKKYLANKYKKNVKSKKEFNFLYDNIQKIERKKFKSNNFYEYGYNDSSFYCNDIDEYDEYDDGYIFEFDDYKKNKALIEKTKKIENKNNLVIKNNNKIFPLIPIGLSITPACGIIGLQSLSFISLTTQAITLVSISTIPVILTFYFIIKNSSIFGIKSRIKKEIKKTELLLNIFSKEFNLNKDLTLTQKMNDQFLLNTLLIDNSEKLNSIDLVVINEKLKNTIKVIEKNMIERAKEI